ncbi:MAG: dihydroxy-acid dehydratase, partial [Acidobacteria bacterium]|nr:dihydroxy-acid dehydratase [Acidobacteriota bacterium]
AVVRFQGPRANGMPELHKLMPQLGVLQDRGFAVALVTDGRLSGASGKVTSAIHVTPEALRGGPLAKVRDGDVILVDPENGVLEARVDAAEWRSRQPAIADLAPSHVGLGRELFTTFRSAAGTAEEGAMTFGDACFGGPPEAEPHPVTAATRPAPAAAVLGGSFEDA